MEKRYKKISIDTIPQGNYQGYYWMSNSSKPVIQDEGDIDKSIFKELPFVVEANYYSSEADISIQIKSVDGQYLVSEINVKDCEVIEYIGHDIGSNYLVVEAWGEKEDDLLEGMIAKVPVWEAFKGFVESNKK
jgi:CRISPR type III-associated protein (TIGR04423 family)